MINLEVIPEYCHRALERRLGRATLLKIIKELRFANKNKRDFDLQMIAQLRGMALTKNAQCSPSLLRQLRNLGLKAATFVEQALGFMESWAKEREDKGGRYLFQALHSFEMASRCWQKQIRGMSFLFSSL